MDLSILQNPVFVWFVTGIVLVLAEFVLPGLVIIFFGLGALAVAGILLIFEIGLFWQLLIFTVVSIVMLMVLRKKIHAKMSTKEERVEEFVGEKAEVKVTIPVGGYGKVQFKGALWKAESDESGAIQKGVWVEIVSYNSITLKVKKIS